MAHARNIKPGFFRNELLAEMPVAARLLFIGLWCLADKAGRLEDRHKRIRLEIFPFDDVDVDGLLNLLAEQGFITRYEAKGKKLIQVENFLKHQSPHKTEKESEYPGQNEQCSDTQHKNDIATHAGNEHATGAKPFDNGVLTVIAGEKDVASPPDSLIHRFTDLTPPLPPRKKRGGKPAITFSEFLSQCKANGECAISDYKPMLLYAEKAQIPIEFIEIAWLEFKRRHSDSGSRDNKRQKDWRRTFQNYVENNWLGVWWHNPATDQYELTSKGRTAEKATA